MNDDLVRDRRLGRPKTRLITQIWITDDLVKSNIASCGLDHVSPKPLLWDLSMFVSVPIRAFTYNNEYFKHYQAYRVLARCTLCTRTQWILLSAFCGSGCDSL